jgi:lipopolysaccharide export system protein LptA
MPTLTEMSFLSGDLIQISISNDSQQTSNVVNLTAVKEIHAMSNATFEKSQYRGKADQITIYPSTKFIILEGHAEIQDANLGTMYQQTLTLD